jgi:hypothetical protein
MANYCGLLPPDWTMEDFERHHSAETHRRTKEPA